MKRKTGGQKEIMIAEEKGDKETRLGRRRREKSTE